MATADPPRLSRRLFLGLSALVAGLPLLRPPRRKTGYGTSYGTSYGRQ